MVTDNLDNLPAAERDDIDEARLEAQAARMEQVRLRASNLGYENLPELTGFEDDYTRRLILAKRYLKKSKLSSLRPLLPMLLQLKGKPYRLNNYFPFEPFFRTRMSKTTLLKTGRQVSKSTSLAAQGVVFSNSIPYFSTLYVTPLFEMIRRFSHNYVRQFLETSPAKRLFIGTKTTNQILQRSFKNGSAMYFSYAFLDAERTRGIPADKCVIDESVRIGTMVSTPNGPRPIETFSPGDAVMGFDEAGYVQEDEVVKCSDHGVRDCYRFEFSDGSAVEATSDSWLATTEGWKRVETIITDLGAGANASGFNVGGRVHSVQPAKPDLPQFSRIQTTRLQLPKVPGIIRVRTHASQENEERRLRGVVESLGDSVATGVLAYRFFVSPRRQEAGVARLQEAELIRVTWTGKHRVFDLETRRHNTFLAGGVAVHNCQDMNYDFLQIIHETLSGSPWGLKQYAGTPKSLDNTMEKLWQDSSQAEWVIRCRQPGCRHWNIPSTSWDLYDMIGPWHKDISEGCPGVVCAKCRKPLNPRLGRWTHAHPERRWSFAGYHVPQIIMPMHYASQEKWDVLVGKMAGRNNTTPTTFLNEVCGVSCDYGAKLVTETDLKNAAVLPWPRRASEAKRHVKKYVRRLLSVDWGGGGGRVSASKKNEEQRLRTSFTSLAVLGMTPDGKVDTLWGHRSLRTHDWEYEARLCIEAVSLFRCSHIVHDYSGAGEGRLVLLHQAGIPPSNIINMRYHGPAAHNIMNFHEATEDHPHDWYSLDKSRSLVTTCMCIKYGLLRFFQYDYQSADNAGLLHDFLALIEEKVDSRVGTDAYVIVRNPNAPDDFAHAVNIGCCALWWMTGRWPNIAEAARMRIDPSVMKHLHPAAKVEWGDL